MSAIHLPDQCGVMLLPDCTLFPHGGLPLFIFEPRYRRMLDEALAADFMFAVVRLLGEETPDPAQCTAPVGTIGLVRASHQQPDGTSRLLLHGVARIRFTEWLDDHEYPCARLAPVFAELPQCKQARTLAAALRNAVEDASRQFPEEVRTALQEMLRRTDDPTILADIVSQHFLQDPDDRQRVLEMESLADRAMFLCQHLAEGPR
jgi:Lon protease-like protein